MTFSGSGGGAVRREIAFHQCGLGSILCSERFLGTMVLHSLHKSEFDLIYFLVNGCGF